MTTSTWYSYPVRVHKAGFSSVPLGMACLSPRPGPDPYAHLVLRTFTVQHHLQQCSWGWNYRKGLLFAFRPLNNMRLYVEGLTLTT